MSVSATESAVAARVPRLDWPFLLASVLALAVLIALVLVDGQPAAAALLVFGFALGAVFLKAEFSFTASWRRLIVRGQADGFLGGLLLIAIAAGGDRSGRRACSGFRRYYRADRAVARHRRLRVRHRHAACERLRLRHALHRRRRLRPHADRTRLLHRRQRDRQPAPAAILRLGGIDPVLASNYFGAWGGLAATLAEPGCGRIGRRCDRAPARRVVRAPATYRARRNCRLGFCALPCSPQATTPGA